LSSAGNAPKLIGSMKPTPSAKSHPPDPAAFVLVGAIVAAFFGLAFLLRRREVASIRGGFQANGSTDAHLVSGETVQGTVDGFPITYRLEQGGKHSPGATILTTPVPEQSARLEMHLRPQGASDYRAIARGLEVDIDVGDEVFDAKVVVEAAPAAVAIKMLDAATRDVVMRHMPLQFDIADGVIRLYKQGKVTDPMHVADLLGGLVQLARRLGTLHFEGDAAAGDEIARLRAVRQVRAGRSSRAGIAMIVVAVLLVGLFVILSSKR
jgi:hypothetical protein